VFWHQQLNCLFSSFSHDPSSGLAGILVATVNVEVRTHPKDGIIIQFAVFRLGNEYPLTHAASARHGLSGLHADKLKSTVVLSHAHSFPQADSGC
jgi:hypothetical protein